MWSHRALNHKIAEFLELIVVLWNWMDFTKVIFRFSVTMGKIWKRFIIHNPEDFLSNCSLRIKLDNNIFTGCFLNFLTLSLFSISNLNPFWILLSTFCGSILGGRPTLFLTFMCYISDLSKTEDKAWNLALMDTAVYSAIAVGLFAGPYTFKHYGYCVVFGMAAGSCLFAVLYSTFLLKETIKYTGNEVRMRKFCTNVNMYFQNLKFRRFIHVW